MDKVMGIRGPQGKLAILFGILFSSLALLGCTDVFIDDTVVECTEESLQAVTGPLLATEANLLVAFIGDQGFNADAEAVLTLIRDEGADMVLHQGDLDYRGKPDEWDQMVSGILGPDFPYFASVGNHDVGDWEDYQVVLQARLDRIEEADCIGDQEDLGIKTACSYKGLFFILSGVGTMDFEHPQFISEQLCSSNSLWRICTWHKNQRLMQVGSKRDEVGWGTYDTCRLNGAIIATGHEHSYSRTHLMDNFGTQKIQSTSNTLEIDRGHSFAFVSGLGGKGIRPQKKALADKPWWASVYTKSQDANHGALFCNFGDGGVDNEAYCYFKDIDGNVPDEFHLINLIN